MNARLLAATVLFVAAGTTLQAQSPSSYVMRPRPAEPRQYAPTPQRSAVLRHVGEPLTLRGGATPTGLGGFYDYQSNGASPSYLSIRQGSTGYPDVIVTTSMVSSDGSSIESANAGRRVGYSISQDGGVTWANTQSIFELRLGFPNLQLSSSGLPYIASHGDLGEGDRTFLFSSSTISALEDYYPVAELPLSTQSGRYGGVAWSNFIISKDGSKAIVFGSYANDLEEPEAPLQVATIALPDGSTQPRWRDLTDSVLSNTSGGLTAAARAPSGRIGIAWFKFELDSTDDTWGIYYAQSEDDGATWSAPTAVLTGDRITDVYGFDGDPDTLRAGANLDLAFRGEEPQLVFTGNVNGLLQYNNIMFWSPSTGLRTAAMSHQEPGLGAYAIPLLKRQQNMESLAYPTITVGDDGSRVVVAFSAVAQQAEGESIVEDVISDLGFNYYRLWGVASADGGRNWGRPFIIQDFAEKRSDSASIEYPSAAETARVTAGSLELPIVFQARRYPGMYIYTGEGTNITDPGPITESMQYFQRFTVTPAMFSAISSVAAEASSNGATAQLYPNRTGTTATLEVTLAAATTLDVTVVDPLGRVVAHPVDEQTAGAGATRVAIDVSTLASGLYHCVVRHDAGVITRKLEVVR